MIVECLIVSFTTIFCVSLLFANNILKNVREDQEKLSQDKKVIECPLQLKPFLLVRDKVMCPVCGCLTDLSYHKGVKPPFSCEDIKKCPAKNVAHLHTFCYSCETRWMMKVKDHEM